MLGGTGLLDAEAPNLTRYVFTDPRARELFAYWDAVADEQAFDLWLGPSVENSEWFTAEPACSHGSRKGPVRTRSALRPPGRSAPTP